MDRRFVLRAILMYILVVTISNLTISSSDNKNTNVMDSFSFMKTVYAQSANSADDYSGLGISSDNPMATVGLTHNSTNSTSGTNPTSATTPEFGSIVPIVLAVSIISIILISARTKLRLD
ncbi:MAG: PEFG-CTERM sorting domain-containing protein [Nitrosotalea sp.]